jgi:hypothetical protein
VRQNEQEATERGVQVHGVTVSIIRSSIIRSFDRTMVVTVDGCQRNGCVFGLAMC